MVSRVFTAVLTGTRRGCCLAALVPMLAAFAETLPAAPERPVTVAVFNLVEDEVVPKGTGAAVAELLTVALSQAPGVNLVERAELAKILNELALQQSGLVAERELVACRLVGADLILSGRVFDIGLRRSIVLKLTSVETQQIVGTSRRTRPDTPLDTPTFAMADDLVKLLAVHRNRLLPSTLPFAELAASLRSDQPLPVVRIELADAPEVEDWATHVRETAAEAGFALQDGDNAVGTLRASCAIREVAAIRHRRAIEIAASLSLAMPNAAEIDVHAESLVIDDGGDDRRVATREVVQRAMLQLLSKLAEAKSAREGEDGADGRQ